MGVENDGSGPSAGPAEPPADSPSTRVDVVPASSSLPSALKTSKSPSAPLPPSNGASSSSKVNGSGGLPHPFHPSNLPEALPTLTPPSPLPQKRHSPEDFTPSEVKEKKAVRFESSVVGGESEEEKEAREKKTKKRRDATERTVSTLAMLGGFFSES